MEDFAGNSKAQRTNNHAEKPKFNPVQGGTGRVAKTSEGKKFLRNLFEEDLQSTTKHIFTDVLVPGLKNGIVDMVRQGVEYLFYGNTNNRNSNNTLRGVSYNYGAFYGQQQNKTVNNYGPVYTLSEIEFNDIATPKEILYLLKEAINEYRVVSVGDYYDLLPRDINGTPMVRVVPQDYKYGWRDLINAEVQRTLKGTYRIRFPKIIQIEL